MNGTNDFKVVSDIKDFIEISKKIIIKYLNSYKRFLYLAIHVWRR